MPVNQNMPMSPTMQALSRPGSAWTGYDPAMMQYSRFNPNQMNQMNQLGMMGMQGLQTGQMPGGVSFDPIAQQAQTQFNTQTLPSIAERFTSLGGGQRSSAFQGALGGAGAGLQENLAAMKSQYNMQMLPMLMQMLGVGLTPQYEQEFLQGQPGILENFGGQFMHGLGSAIPGLAAGGFGKAASGGTNLISMLSKLFGGGKSPESTGANQVGAALYNVLKKRGTFGA